MFSLTACLAFLENEKDEEAFLRYYERYHRLVLYEAEKIVGPSAAEDVMQNTFVYIAKHFSTFRSGSSKKVRVFQLYGCLGSPEESRPASIFAMILAKGTPKSLVMNLSKVIYDMVPKSVLG